MSVIYEALKKIEASTGSANITNKTQKRLQDVLKPYLIYVPAICLGFLIGSLLFHYFIATKKNNPDAKLKGLSEEIKPVEINTPPLEVAQPQKASQPLLILNGIFSSQNEGYALINNRIVKEGDNVEGATVIRIKPDLVELKFRGSAITLSNKGS